MMSNYYRNSACSVRHVMLGVDDDAAVALRHSALHISPEIAVEYGLGDMILEMAGVGPFETHERIGEQTDTPSVALDDVGGIRLWVRVAHEVGESGVSHMGSFHRCSERSKSPYKYIPSPYTL